MIKSYFNYIRIYNQIKNKNKHKSYLNLWKEYIIEEINNMKNTNLFYSDNNKFNFIYIL